MRKDTKLFWGCHITLADQCPCLHAGRTHQSLTPEISSSVVASHWAGLISHILNNFNWRLQPLGQTNRWEANRGCKEESIPCYVYITKRLQADQTSAHFTFLHSSTWLLPK